MREYNIQFHKGSHPKPVMEGVSFLGFRIFPDRIRLKRRKGVQYQRKLKQLICAYRHGAILSEELVASVLAWNNHASHGNTLNLRKQLFSCLPPDITMMAHWQLKRSLAKRSAKRFFA